MAGAGEVVTLASVVVAAVVEVTVGAGVVLEARLGVELCWKLWAGLEKVGPSKLI